MFHTFQGLAPPRPPNELSQQTAKPAGNGTHKRITTAHACAECKRRKIRCDGRQPCGQCLGCRSPKPCYYDKHRQRIIPSRKTLDALSKSLEDCRVILKRLYPSHEIDTLLPLSRQELLSLLGQPKVSSIESQSSPTINQISPSSGDLQSPRETSDDDCNMSNLELVPSQDTDWDEERRNKDPIPVESDDVNALSLSVERQSSYLGASSIKAAFLVMLKVAPVLKTFLAPATSRAVPVSNTATPRPAPAATIVQKATAGATWSSEGQTLIDAYFNRVHLFIPMLDEPSFRRNYLASQRNDAPWFALLNMVFAMGSIVAMKSDNNSHVTYYNRAMDHLSLDSFASGHIETLQALGIIGGYYLHYINRPNMANAIMGAALRMATASGLHRETTGAGRTDVDENYIPADIRRRTWWSLFCLDTWASTTLGRPSLGRWGHAITILPPAATNESLGHNLQVIPLIENIKFCKIATQIQDTLAITPLPRIEDRATLEAQLIDWYDTLPAILRSSEACSEGIMIVRSVMKWRLQNLRMYLHRPVLLNIANRGTQTTMTLEEAKSVEKCREIAKETIDDIKLNWTRNQMSGWNAVWFLYQASMIPLVSIFWESRNITGVREWQRQIRLVIDLLTEMSDWSLAARRSSEVVSKMYEASMRPATEPTSPTSNTVEETSRNYSQVEMEEGMVLLDHGQTWDLDGMFWGNLSEGLDYPFDGVPRVEFEGNDQMPGFGGEFMMPH